MTIDEAITQLNTFKISAKSELGENALDLAIKALEKEPCEDTISRQAAIDVLDKRFDSIPMEQTTEILQLRKDLRELPSAQPDIIRCGDCKWYGRADKRRFYRGMDCLQKRIDTIVPDRDFCSKAERRTDD